MTPEENAAIDRLCAMGYNRNDVIQAFFACELTQEVIFSGLGSVAPATASVAFGGKALDTVYVGSLFGTRIPYFTAPVSGEPPIWW